MTSPGSPRTAIAPGLLDRPVTGRLELPESSPGRVASRLGVGFETLDRELFDPEKVYPLLGELGVGWARVQSGWSRCETSRGSYDFAWLDDIVDRLAAAGVSTLFSLTFGNVLYTTDAPHSSAVGYVPVNYSADVVAAWQRYVTALVAHFRERVTHWEVWNEPNIPQFWMPRQENGAEYARLVALTAAAVRESAPDAVIVGGALSRVDPIFLEEALQEGLAASIDVLTFHPYQPVPEHNLRNMYDLVRRMLDRYSPPGSVEIWQGEAGCPSQAFGHNDDWLGLYDIDEDVQARWVARRVLADLGSGFSRSFYFHAVDLMAKAYRQSDGGERPPVMMGLIRGDTYEPKTAFEVLRRVAFFVDDATERRELLHMFREVDERHPEQTGMMAAPCATSFVRDGHPVLAYWLGEDPQQRTSPREIQLQFWWDDDVTLDRPVLVDVLTGTVHAVEPMPIDEQLAFDAILGVRFTLPITDYPVILTDAAAVPGYVDPRPIPTGESVLQELRRRRYRDAE